MKFCALLRNEQENIFGNFYNRMPEGPELFRAAQFVNKCCRNVEFASTWKPKYNKSPPIWVSSCHFTVTAESRGKEIKLLLQSIGEFEPSAKRAATSETSDRHETDRSLNRKSIVMRFGMSARFEYTTVVEMNAKARLRFFAADGKHVLSFITPFRGVPVASWSLQDHWSPDRGPDPVDEFVEFKTNIIDSLNCKDFDKPICEVLLDQRYFNGCGNYLRAEILHRYFVWLCTFRLGLGFLAFDCFSDIL